MPMRRSGHRCRESTSPAVVVDLISRCCMNRRLPRERWFREGRGRGISSPCSMGEPLMRGEILQRVEMRSWLLRGLLIVGVNSMLRLAPAPSMSAGFKEAEL